MNKRTVVLASPILTVSGYGARARDIAYALLDNDQIDVYFIAIQWGSTPQTALDATNSQHQRILSRIISHQMSTQPDVFIHLTIPNEFQAAGKYNIGITAGIETDQCRGEWIEGCNRMDLVLTSSAHSAQVFKNMVFTKKDTRTGEQSELRLNTKVDVLFEGVDLSTYDSKYDSNVQLSIDNIKESSCILFVGHWLQGILGQDRKDVSGLVHTFLRAFANTPTSKRPALVLKTSGATFSKIDRSQILEKIHHIQEVVRTSLKFEGVLPSIYLLHGEMSSTQINALYNHPKVKAMVSFTKGEGFGRPLLEFMTTGKPLLAPIWSGQADFINNDVAFGLIGSVGPVHESATNDWIIKGSNWFTVDYKYAEQMLKQVINPTSYQVMVETSRKSKKWVRDKFSIKAMAQQLNQIVNDAPVALQHTAVIPDLPKQTLTLPKLKKRS